MSEKDAQKFDFQLWLPPRGVEPEDSHPYFGAEAEMREFDKSMGGHGFGR